MLRRADTENLLSDEEIQEVMFDWLLVHSVLVLIGSP